MNIYIIRNEKSVGPYTVDEIVDFIRNGDCSPTEFGWHDLLTEWTTLETIVGTHPVKNEGVSHYSYRDSAHSTGFNHTTYSVRKKLKVFGGALNILDPDGITVFHAQQKSFSLKGDFRIYTGEEMHVEVLSILGKKVMDPRFEVTDSIINVKVGSIKKSNNATTLIRDEWFLYDANDKQIGSILEDNMHLALLRRGLNQVWFNPIPKKYHGIVNGEHVCRFHENFNPFGATMTFDFSMDANALLDRRLGIACAVLLCAS